MKLHSTVTLSLPRGSKQSCLPFDLIHSPTYTYPHPIDSHTQTMSQRTDQIGPTPGYSHSASYSSADPGHDARLASETQAQAHGADPSPRLLSESPSQTNTSGGGKSHAQAIAQSQGLKLDPGTANAGVGGERYAEDGVAGTGSVNQGGGNGAGRRPGGLADNPNARSKTITMAMGDNTYGVSISHEKKKLFELGLWLCTAEDVEDLFLALFIGND